MSQQPLFAVRIRATGGVTGPVCQLSLGLACWVQHGDLPGRLETEAVRLEIHWQPTLDPMESAGLGLEGMVHLACPGYPVQSDPWKATESTR